VGFRITPKLDLSEKELSFRKGNKNQEIKSKVQSAGIKIIEECGQINRAGLMIMDADESPVWESDADITTSLDIGAEYAKKYKALLDTGSSVLVASEAMAAEFIRKGAKTRVGRKLAVKDAQQNIFTLDKEVELLVILTREDGEKFRLRKYFYIYDTGHDLVINKATLINEGLAAFILGDNAGILHKNLDLCPEIEEEWLNEESTRVVTLICLQSYGDQSEITEILRKENLDNFVHNLQIRASAEERKNNHCKRLLKYSCIKMIEVLEYPTIAEGFVNKLGAMTLCKDFSEIFSATLPSEGPIGLEEMVIKVKDGYVPKSEPLRHFTPLIQEQIHKEITKHLEAGIIRRSTAKPSQVVPVRKPDDTYRMCNDFTYLNDNTINAESWPLPKVEEILTRLSKKKFFARFDLLKGFHQLLLDEASKHLTAFVTKSGVYEYNRVPMGCKGAPAFFQRQMESVVFKDLIDLICQVYIDDIVVYGDTEDELLENLKKIFERLQKYGMRIKGTKSEIGARSIKFLGSIVDADGIHIDPARKQAIMDMASPTNVTTLKSFMGVAQYCKKFVPGFDKLSKPLNELTKKNVKFEWTQERQDAFEAIRLSIFNSDILHHIDYSLPIILRVDASKSGCGGQLLQIRTIDKRDEQGNLVLDEYGQPLKERVEENILFFSHTFSAQAAVWSTIEQECFAIFHGVTRLQEYLLGVPFTLETDHRNLLWLSKSNVPKLVRWRLRLQEFDMNIVHVPGATQYIADGLSRCLPIKAIKRYNQKHYNIVKGCHNAIKGHRGRQQLEEHLRSEGYDFPLMQEMIDNIVTACHTCQKVKGQVISSNRFPLGSLMTKQPWDTISMDYIGPISPDKYGNKYILVVIDNFTRFVELFVTPNAGSDEAAKAILSIYGRYGLPRVIHTDQGSHFTANIVEELCEYLSVKKQYSLPYRPQANGIVERCNKEIVQHLQSLVMDKRIIDDWGIHVPIVQRIVNTMFHTAIGTTPARLMYGSHAVDNQSLIDCVIQGKVPMEESTEYIKRLDNILDEYYNKAIEIQDKYIEAHLNRQPKMPISHEFEEGQYVVILWNVKPAGKLKPKWRGPLRIIKKGDTIRTYVCLDLVSKKEIEVDVGNMKPFHLQRDTDPLDVAIVDRDEYRVDHIVTHRLNGNKKGKKTFSSFLYRIRWEGYDPKDDTWEEYSTIKDTEAFELYSKTNSIVQSQG